MLENYFLIHGSFGSPYSNWLPSLRNTLESQNKIVYTPDFPTGGGYQTYENWASLLNVYVKSGLIHENTTFIAHSIAPVFICKFLIENKIKVKKCIFVCGFNNYLGINEEYDTVNKSMYTPLLEQVKEYVNEIICLYTDNDPYVNRSAEEEFASTIATKQELIPGGGHLNTESGFTQADFLLRYL